MPGPSLRQSTVRSRAEDLYRAEVRTARVADAALQGRAEVQAVLHRTTGPGRVQGARRAKGAGQHQV